MNIIKFVALFSYDVIFFNLNIFKNHDMLWYHSTPSFVQVFIIYIIKVPLVFVPIQKTTKKNLNIDDTHIFLLFAHCWFFLNSNYVEFDFQFPHLTQNQQHMFVFKLSIEFEYWGPFCLTLFLYCVNNFRF